jgi:YVTN family beta-propeller protein
VVDARTYEVAARVAQASVFSPNLAVSRDGAEVWFTLKDSGKTQVMSAEEPFAVRATIETGSITNHVSLVDNADGRFAYVTVGGENAVKVFRRGEMPELVATIHTGDLPHGIWPSDDGTRVYVGLENQDAVVVIDTHRNEVLATIPIGQQPQALVYVPGAVPEGDGTANLAPLGEAGKAAHLTLGAAPGDAGSTANATVSVNSLGSLDLLQVAVCGLKAQQSYTLWLVASRTAPHGDKQALATFKTNVSGAQIVQAVGPLRRVLAPTDAEASRSAAQRFLIVTASDSEVTYLVQDMPARGR